jgi:tetratricopeptide (TPR) repeat protein
MTMMKKIPMMKMMTALTLMMAASACDYAQKREFRHERKDSRYQSAMADYRAGRLDRAMASFAEILKDDPANASARFQLACLLQDAKRDYLGAYCQYREYLLQQPDSERSKLAEDRLAVCEREMVLKLADKHGITSGKVYADEIGKLKAQLVESEKKSGELEKELQSSMDKVASLEDDRKRLVQAVRGETDTEKDLKAPSLKDARALLDEDDENTDRIALSQDVKSLKSEGDEELAHAAKGPAILPAQPKDAKAKRDAARKAAQGSRGDRPAEYTVEDGDTLYKIAERFYGRTSAWTEIRNANRTVISVDGRVKAGDRIVLP